jgi:hypothetical protein
MDIQPQKPPEDDALVDELFASSAAFQALVARSKASPRKPFGTGQEPPNPPQAVQAD